MAKSLWNIFAAREEISARDSAVDAALAAAKITAVKVDGKEVAVAEAPFAAKVAALAGQPAASEPSAELLATNQQLAGKVEELEGKLTASAASVTDLTAKNTTLAGKVAELETAVSAAQGKATEFEGKFKTASGDVLAQNTALTELCLAANILDLKDAKGNALAKDAKAEDKQAAALAVPFADKLQAYRGAVNAAIARTGASPLEIPAAPPSAATGAGSRDIMAEYNKISDPTERVAFYRKNRAEIDAAHRK